MADLSKEADGDLIAELVERGYRVAEGIDVPLDEPFDGSEALEMVICGGDFLVDFIDRMERHRCPDELVQAFHSWAKDPSGYIIDARLRGNQ